MRIEPRDSTAVELVGGVGGISVQPRIAGQLIAGGRGVIGRLSADGTVIKAGRFRLEAADIQRPGRDLAQTTRCEVLNTPLNTGFAQSQALVWLGQGLGRQILIRRGLAIGRGRIGRHHIGPRQPCADPGGFDVLCRLLLTDGPEVYGRRRFRAAENIPNEAHDSPAPFLKEQRCADSPAKPAPSRGGL